jgi:hypothetical protein
MGTYRFCPFRKTENLKKIILYAILLVFVHYSITGQEKKMIPAGIKKAFVSGDSKLLATHFTQSIELLIKNKEDVYSKAQAELILKEFFRKNSPNTFIVEHEGESDGIKYAICNLKTTRGKFRIYLAYQNIKGKPMINRLNISEYN